MPPLHAVGRKLVHRRAVFAHVVHAVQVSQTGASNVRLTQTSPSNAPNYTGASRMFVHSEVMQRLNRSCKATKKVVFAEFTRVI